MSALTASLDEAKEHLRVIRQTMERSNQYSTLSGWSGILIGLLAIAATFITRLIIGGAFNTATVEHHAATLALVWLWSLLLAIGIEFLCNKRRAKRVGKYVLSKLGAHIMVASTPAFLGAAVLTLFFYQHGLLPYVFGIWMLCYGLAISAVGLFSVKPVIILGLAFVASGMVTLLTPLGIHLYMMAISFGLFHIVYGIVMARRYGW